MNFIGPQQKGTRPPPPPPPSSNNSEYPMNITLNPESVSKFNQMTNYNGSSSSVTAGPPPPPRNAPANNFGGTVRRQPPPTSDFIENTPPDRRSDQRNSAALEYDLEFESRFRFTPIDNLPPPEPWKPQPTQPPVKSSKNISVN